MNEQTCESVRELLVDYADGDLPGESARPVADHLAGCPSCRRELAALRVLHVHVGGAVGRSREGLQAEDPDHCGDGDGDADGPGDLRGDAPVGDPARDGVAGGAH